MHGVPRANLCGLLANVYLAVADCLLPMAYCLLPVGPAAVQRAWGVAARTARGHCRRRGAVGPFSGPLMGCGSAQFAMGYRCRRGPLGRSRSLGGGHGIGERGLYMCCRIR